VLPLPIATGYYTSEILTLAAQTCSNWIPIKPTGGALNTRALLDRRGLTAFATLSGEFRGDLDYNGVYLTVNSTVLSSVASDGTVTAITGSIAGNGRLSIAKNDDYVVFVNNLGEGYYYDGSTVTKITDGDFLSASTVVFIDGYFLFTTTDGTKFFVSGLNDPSAYDALDRSTAELRPDPIVAAYVYNNLLHIAGTETTEKYNNIGGVSFPFQRINQAANSVGCYSKFTPIEVGNSYAFIGGGKNEGAQVYLLSGGQPQVISTPAIDTQLQLFNDAELANAFSFVFEDRGQHIIGFTFSSDRITDRTFCFNMSSGEWFEFKSGTSKWRAKSVTRVYNKFLCGDDSNQVGYLTDTHTDYGDTIFREKASQPFLAREGDEYRIGLLEAWFQAGTGDATTNPQIMMDFSDDLGKTWSNETWRGLGKVGEYGKRTQWRKQGLVTRNRVYRFKASDPFEFNFMKLTASA
jgi:hypothetical protein